MNRSLAVLLCLPIAAWCAGQSSSAPAATIPTPTIPLNPSSLTFTAEYGGANQSKRVTLGGGDGLPFQATTESGWIEVSPASGTAPCDLTITVKPSQVDAGKYDGNVVLKSNSTNIGVIPVTLTVLPVLAVNPQSLEYYYVPGGPEPLGQAINATSRGAVSLPFTASTSQPWISVTPDKSSTPLTLNVKIDPSKVTGSGLVNGTITVSSPNVANRNVAVSLKILAPDLVLSPFSLEFKFGPGDPTPAPQTFRVTTTGESVPFTLKVDQPWLIVSPSSGATPATVTVSVDPKKVDGYRLLTGNITVSSPKAANQFLAIILDVRGRDH